MYCQKCHSFLEFPNINYNSTTLVAFKSRIMPRNKTPAGRIGLAPQRKTSYFKRRMGINRKGMELHQLTGADVFIYIKSNEQDANDNNQIPWANVYTSSHEKDIRIPMMEAIKSLGTNPLRIYRSHQLASPSLILSQVKIYEPKVANNNITIDGFQTFSKTGEPLGTYEAPHISSNAIVPYEGVNYQDMSFLQNQQSTPMDEEYMMINSDNIDLSDHMQMLKLFTDGIEYAPNNYPSTPKNDNFTPTYNNGNYIPRIQGHIINLDPRSPNAPEPLPIPIPQPETRRFRTHVHSENDTHTAQLELRYTTTSRRDPIKSVLGNLPAYTTLSINTNKI